MKIMIFGRGAVGTLYGWAFIKAGHHGEYFVRSGRAAEYRQQLEVNVLDCRKKARGVLFSDFFAQLARRCPKSTILI